MGNNCKNYCQENIKEEGKNEQEFVLGHNKEKLSVKKKSIFNEDHNVKPINVNAESDKTKEQELKKTQKDSDIEINVLRVTKPSIRQTTSELRNESHEEFESTEIHRMGKHSKYQHKNPNDEEQNPENIQQKLSEDITTGKGLSQYVEPKNNKKSSTSKELNNENELLLLNLEGIDILQTRKNIQS